MNFSFDVGMASLGVAVNKDGDVIYADSLLMHADTGGIKEQAERRRQYRTREAHKGREAALELLWQNIGKQPLQRKRFEKVINDKGKREFIKTKADERLEREFPAKGDNTVYASSLLRIMLIEGKKLEDWQIYKALHASIQRRGYDKDVPWKKREAERQVEKDTTKPSNDKNPENQIDEFYVKLKKMTTDPQYQLPCYYDAYKMGLWDNKSKKIVHIRQQSEILQKARKYNPSRELVTQEIHLLLEQAANQISALVPHLHGKKLDELLYGKQNNAIHKRYPSYNKVDGLLGQKYPRFENRIVSNCALIPRLHVCKAKKLLAIEVGFLMRLVNWRYEVMNERGDKELRMLTGEEIGHVLHNCLEDWKKKKQKYGVDEYAEKYALCFKLKKPQVSKRVETLNGSVKVGHETIEKSKHTGRSRFSQPALLLMKKLILSDKTPTDCYDEWRQILEVKADESESEFGYTLFDDVDYKYFPDDLMFLEKMKGGRESIYVPNVSVVEQYVDKGDGGIDGAIQNVINSCNWPELRHRLGVFRHELENLVEKFGEPDRVHLEFIREDFLSEKKKSEYIKQSSQGQKAHQEAAEELKKMNIGVTRENITRYRLCMEQNKICLYTGEPLDISKIENYEIDHIFPKKGGGSKGGGPDAQYNKVLTSSDVNRNQKGKHLPCECDFINDKWQAFKKRVNDTNQLSKNKKKLLLASSREEAETLIEKYTGLAGTAHIARLARDIVCLQFGWQPGEKDEQQRVLVVSGGLTNKVARKYKLYSILGDSSQPHKKDRTDHRHHALDAMVISYLHQWMRDKNKTDFFKFPDGVDANYFAEKLKNVYPHYVTKIRPAIAEQPKPYRKSGKNKMNKTEFRNISKDIDERGQWYTNKSKTGKGTAQHGYIFYKDEKNRIYSKAIHSFRSPYAVEKEVIKKSTEVIGVFWAGKSIELPEQKKIKATKLGRECELKYGKYRIIITRNKDVTIEDSVHDNDQKENENSLNRYRIKLDNLQKIRISNAMEKGKEFQLNHFLLDKNTVLSGPYKMQRDESGKTIINIQTGEKSIFSYKKIVQELYKQNWQGDVKENELIPIHSWQQSYSGKVEHDKLPNQLLPGERYTIKAFTGKRIHLTAQDATIYELNSEILIHAKPNITE